MPKAVAAGTLVDTATKWRATAASRTPAASNQSRTAIAFSAVSSVFHDFEATITSVVAGFSDAAMRRQLIGSRLVRKCVRKWGAAKSASASQASCGPRCEPPMPMLTTSVIGCPDEPSQRPPRTSSLNAAIRSRTPCTWATTSSPSTISRDSRGSRSAVCSTERRSVVLIRSPRNIAPRRSESCERCANWSSASRSRSVSALRARSTYRPAASADRRCSLWGSRVSSSAMRGPRD